MSKADAACTTGSGPGKVAEEALDQGRDRCGGVITVVAYTCTSSQGSFPDAGSWSLPGGPKAQLSPSTVCIQTVLL